MVVACVAAACVTAVACIPAVAGIAAIADAPLVPDVFTIAGVAAPEQYNDFDFF